MPKVSVIIPAYIDNSEKLDWLKFALQSIQSQSIFQDIEVLVIDDASPIKVDFLHSEFPWARWFRSSRQQGPALCRNTAVVLARGEAILPLDADDLLADNNVAEMLYSVWSTDSSKIIYGDVQQLKKSENGNFEIGRKFSLPQYTFERVMDLNGTIPVTAMHSKSCHEHAGGWKKELEFGLEDIEYWIAAGKAGYCGHKIDHTILQYRKHDNSRSYKLRRVNRQELNTRKKIQEIHNDIFEGRFPVGCCGSNNISGPAVPAQAQMNRAPGTLDQYPESEKIWVEYAGRRTAQFGVVGPHTNITYNIHGPSFKFEVHANDVHKFRMSGRGQDFVIGIPAPAGFEPIKVDNIPAEYVAAEPQLAEIEQLDDIAAGNGQPAVNEQLESPANEMEMIMQITNAPVTEVAKGGVLDTLELTTALQQQLELEGWNIQSLAEAESGDLQPYKGIGPAKETAIIAKAKALLQVV